MARAGIFDTVNDGCRWKVRTATMAGATTCFQRAYAKETSATVAVNELVMPKNIEKQRRPRIGRKPALFSKHDIDEMALVRCDPVQSRGALATRLDLQIPVPCLLQIWVISGKLTKPDINE
jgi:hypothetical protein